MKAAIVIIFMLGCTKVFSQNWHSATDTLKLPTNQGHGQVAMGFQNKFDTVACVYKLIGSDVIRKGYKYVFILDGFYIDTINTMNVFFDYRKQRINGVEKFHFD
jgi:hypothetical protein